MGKAPRMTEDTTARTASTLEVGVGAHAAFTASRALTETLAARLAAEDQTAQSVPDASPTKSHRAHTTWFYEAFLLGPAGGYQAFDDGFVLTPFNQAAIDDPDLLEKQVQSIPFKRAAQPGEIARLAVFWASSDADYVTVARYVMDGGLMRNLGQGA